MKKFFHSLKIKTSILGISVLAVTPIFLSLNSNKEDDFQKTLINTFLGTNNEDNLITNQKDLDRYYNETRSYNLGSNILISLESNTDFSKYNFDHAYFWKTDFKYFDLSHMQKNKWRSLKFSNAIFDDCINFGLMKFPFANGADHINFYNDHIFNGATFKNWNRGSAQGAYIVGNDYGGQFYFPNIKILNSNIDSIFNSNYTGGTTIFKFGKTTIVKNSTFKTSISFENNVTQDDIKNNFVNLQNRFGFDIGTINSSWTKTNIDTTSLSLSNFNPEIDYYNELKKQGLPTAPNHTKWIYRIADEMLDNDGWKLYKYHRDLFKVKLEEEPFNDDSKTDWQQILVEDNINSQTNNKRLVLNNNEKVNQSINSIDSSNAEKNIFKIRIQKIQDNSHNDNLTTFANSLRIKGDVVTAHIKYASIQTHDAYGQMILSNDATVLDQKAQQSIELGVGNDFTRSISSNHETMSLIPTLKDGLTTREKIIEIKAKVSSIDVPNREDGCMLAFKKTNFISSDSEVTISTQNETKWYFNLTDDLVKRLNNPFQTLEVALWVDNPQYTLSNIIKSKPIKIKKINLRKEINIANNSFSPIVSNDDWTIKNNITFSVPIMKDLKIEYRVFKDDNVTVKKDWSIYEASDVYKNTLNNEYVEIRFSSIKPQFLGFDASSIVIQRWRATLPTKQINVDPTSFEPAIINHHFSSQNLPIIEGTKLQFSYAKQGGVRTGWMDQIPKDEIFKDGDHIFAKYILTTNANQYKLSWDDSTEFVVGQNNKIRKNSLSLILGLSLGTGSLIPIFQFRIFRIFKKRKNKY